MEAKPVRKPVEGKKVYSAPVLTTFGQAAKLTAAGTRGAAEAGSQAITKIKP